MTWKETPRPNGSTFRPGEIEGHAPRPGDHQLLLGEEPQGGLFGRPENTEDPSQSEHPSCVPSTIWNLHPAQLQHFVLKPINFPISKVKN